MTQRPLAAILSCQGYNLTEQEKQLFSTHPPLGIILFSRNISSKAQLKNLTKEIRETIGNKDIIIAVDQEGGRVRRLAEPEFNTYSSQYDIGSLSKDKAELIAKLHAYLISCDLHDVGINVNLAPVLDICYNETTEALRSRCFSSSPQTVADLGKISIDNYMLNGIIPCIKHIPGHGLAVSDPHLGLPIIDISKERLATEFYPFKQCSYAPLGMTAHILLPQIDKNNPATQSKLIINHIIRQEIGFNGLLISDSIDMKALKGTLMEKVHNSLNAGCDCICYCKGNIKDLELLSSSCPKLSDEGLERLDKALQILHNSPNKIKYDQYTSEYSSIMNSISPYQESYDATEVLHQL